MSQVARRPNLRHRRRPVAFRDRTLERTIRNILPTGIGISVEQPPPITGGGGGGSTTWSAPTTGPTAGFLVANYGNAANFWAFLTWTPPFASNYSTGYLPDPRTYRLSVWSGSGSQASPDIVNKVLLSSVVSGSLESVCTVYLTGLPNSGPYNFAVTALNSVLNEGGATASSAFTALAPLSYNNAGFTAVSALPATLTNGNNYKLTANLTIPNGNTAGVTISGANVRLDLNGFRITYANGTDARQNAIQVTAAATFIEIYDSVGGGGTTPGGIAGADGHAIYASVSQPASGNNLLWVHSLTATLIASKSNGNGGNQCFVALAVDQGSIGPDGSSVIVSGNTITCNGGQTGSVRQAVFGNSINGRAYGNAVTIPTCVSGAYQFCMTNEGSYQGIDYSNNTWVMDNSTSSAYNMGGGAITGITQAANGVISFNTVSGTNPFAYAVGNLNLNFFIQGLAGMIQLNNTDFTVTATGGVSGAWTVTISTNTSAMGAWTSGGTIVPSMGALQFTYQFVGSATMNQNITHNKATVNGTMTGDGRVFHSDGGTNINHLHNSVTVGAGFSAQNSGILRCHSFRGGVINASMGYPIVTCSGANTQVIGIRIGDTTDSSHNNGWNVTALTATNPVVGTFSAAGGAAPYPAGAVVTFWDCTGMTQINSLTTTIASTGGVSGAWTETTGINGLAFTAYNANSGRVGRYVQQAYCYGDGSTINVTDAGQYDIEFEGGVAGAIEYWNLGLRNPNHGVCTHYDVSDGDGQYANLYNVTFTAGTMGTLTLPNGAGNDNVHIGHDTGITTFISTDNGGSNTGITYDAANTRNGYNPSAVTPSAPTGLRTMG
jgi:hypothetical protein